MTTETMTATKASKRAKASSGDKARKDKAQRMLALLVKVNTARVLIGELVSDPDLRDAMKASPFDGDKYGFGPDDVGECDLPLHKAADGAALEYARLTAGKL
jgi:hypothetical protein